MLIWSILLLILVLVGLTEFSTLRTGVPTVASFPPSRKKIVEVLRKDRATHGEAEPYRIVDLGSGNGQLATAIASALPDATVTGVEISVVPWAIASLRQKIFGPRNLEFRRQSFWPYDVSNADAVVLYLCNDVLPRISQKLRDELKPGTLVVINEIPLQGTWQPVETIETGFLKMKVYVYRQG